MRHVVARLIGVMLILTLSSYLFGAGCVTTKSPYAFPKTIDTSAKYLFYLHNRSVERYGPSSDNDYHGVIKALQTRGFRVVSELRGEGTIVNVYAKEVAGQVKRLLSAGVPPQNISVVGHSKGAYITLIVAALVGNPKVSYVCQAGCGLSYWGAVPQPLVGRILSIYAANDSYASSCKSDFARAGAGLTSREIKFKTGGHGIFGTPKAVWLNPVVNWINAAR